MFSMISQLLENKGWGFPWWYLFPPDVSHLLKTADKLSEMSYFMVLLDILHVYTHLSVYFDILR